MRAMRPTLHLIATRVNTQAAGGMHMYVSMKKKIITIALAAVSLSACDVFVLITTDVVRNP